MTYDFNVKDIGVEILIGLNEDVSGASQVSLICTSALPTGQGTRQVFTKTDNGLTVGDTSQSITDKVSKVTQTFEAGFWIKYTTATATDYVEQGPWEFQAVSDWADGSQSFSSNVIPYNLGPRL